jgi:hypothetical protein
VYNYDEVRRWTTEKKLKRMGQASASVLDCDRVVIPVRSCYVAEKCAGHCRMQRDIDTHERDTIMKFVAGCSSAP